MKISGVTVSRNDNYGEDLVLRAYYSLYSMYNSFDEVIYVDWNSPNNQSLFDRIKETFPKDGKIKHICVTNEFVNSLNLPPESQRCLEVMARNIGIRRATNDWIVSTNIDIIVPLIFAEEDFDQNTFYMISRRDITLEELKNFNGSVLEIQDHLYHDLDKYLSHGYSGINSSDKWSIIDSCGDFQMAHRDIWYTIKGFEEEMIYRGFADSNVQRKAYNAGFNLKPLFNYPVFHISHKGGFGGVGGINNADKYVINFNKITSNVDTWGFSTVDFPVEIW